MKKSIQLVMFLLFSLSVYNCSTNEKLAFKYEAISQASKSYITIKTETKVFSDDILLENLADQNFVWIFEQKTEVRPDNTYFLLNVLKTTDGKIASTSSTIVSKDGKVISQASDLRDGYFNDNEILDQALNGIYTEEWYEGKSIHKEKTVTRDSIVTISKMNVKLIDTDSEVLSFLIDGTTEVSPNGTIRKNSPFFDFSIQSVINGTMRVKINNAILSKTELVIKSHGLYGDSNTIQSKGPSQIDSVVTLNITPIENVIK